METVKSIKKSSLQPLSQNERSGYTQLSPYQILFYNEYRIEPSANKYNIIFDQTISNRLDISQLQCALHRFIREHLIFNSHIIEIDDEVRWQQNAEIRELDYFREVCSEQQIFEYVTKPFNLEHEPLYRFAIFVDIDSNYRFIMVMHHILIDGNSFDELIHEISQYYNNSSHKASLSLEEQLQLVSLTTEQLDSKAKLNTNKNKQFWLDSLLNVEPVDLRCFKSNAASEAAMKNNLQQSDTGIGEILFDFGDIIVNRLQHLDDKYGISMYWYGQIIFAILIAQYSSQTRFAISYPILIKEQQGLACGAGVNTNIFPCIMDGNATIRGLIDQVKLFSNEIKSYNHGYYPTYEIMYGLNKDLLNVFFAQTNLKRTMFFFDGAECLKINTEFNIDLPAKLIFEQELKSKILSFRARYRKLEIDETILKNFINHYKKLFHDILLDIEQGILTKPVMNYEPLTSKEYNEIVHGWNNSHKCFPLEKTLHTLFEEQVQRTPDNIAVVFRDTILTYKELNEKSNQLACYLRSTHRIKGDDLIVLYLDRSEYMLIAILGVLKSGGAYVPIDTNYPEERIAYILRETKSRVFLTNTAHESKLRLLVEKNVQLSDLEISDDKHICNLENTEFKYMLSKYDSRNLVNNIASANLAYVIYTSGTTGKPKGVMIEHRNVVSLVINSGYLDVNEQDGFLFLSNIAFDAAIFEIFTPILHGCKLVIPENNLELMANLSAFKDVLSIHQISCLWLTKTLFDQLLLANMEIFSQLNNLIVGGEALDIKLIRSLAGSRYRPLNILNGYGPTENTTFSCTFKIEKQKLLNLNSVPIGKCLKNRMAYVLNSNKNPLPIGAIGELYLGGAGVARGYLNQAELTNEKFISNPFQTNEDKLRNRNSRLYRTGDLVRYLPDGNLEYIGRNDHQLKIRGFRIELGEIEAVLNSYPDIKNSVVLPKEQAGNKYLIAYYIAELEQDEDLIMCHLAKNLPEYMIPSVFLHMNSFPVTINGKLDRAALLNMEVVKKNHLLPPETDVEESLLSIWSDVLGTNQISIDDKFFQVGGNSLLAMQLQKRLVDFFKMEFFVMNIFQYPTIRTFAEFILSKREAEIIPVKNSEYTEVAKNKINQSNEVAIIGMACRVPGANNIHEFWKNLESGIESIKTINEDELIAGNLQAWRTTDKKYVNRAANIDDYEKFDAMFFNYTPKEAESMDPQHRHFMEVVWEALEDSGHAPNKYQGQIGVYAGQGESTYYLNNIYGNLDLGRDLGDYQLRINNDKDFLATKVSFKLNLKGPSLNLQSACSTSLVAVHIAVQQLLAGDCDIAVAGGVSIAQRYGYKYKEGFIESVDGVCRAFDENATGTLVSSGVGVVILKPLSKALADGNHIYATIKGIAINNDGSNKIGYTAPSISGQAAVIQKALTNSGIDPTTISYIETHGTGTKLGDPIEITALHQVFSQYQKQNNSIAIGSVKTNIGHTDAAAGVIGLIKTALSLNYKKIPASLHFQEWNHEITPFNKIFYVNNTLANWKSINDSPRRAGVSSFGIGGTNAHVILEEASVQINNNVSRPAQLFLLSAKTKTSLENYSNKLTDFIHYHAINDLAGIAYTQHVGREHYKYRKFIVSSSINNLKEQLHDISMVSPFTCLADTSKPLNLVFMFSGQGSQYINMGAQLYEYEPIFSQAVKDCCEILKNECSLDLLSLFFLNHGDEEIASKTLMQTQYAQPALFVIEYAVSKLLISFGIKPAALIGHSIGEYVAATISGIFELKDALKLIALRGKLMQSALPGSMLSVAMSYDSLLLILPDNLDIAAVNGSKLCVVSGELLDIQKFSESLSLSKVEHSQLHTSHAFHSRMMLPIRSRYLSALKEVKKNPPLIPIISNVTGDWLSIEQAISDEYWCEHLIMPVLFHQGLKKILAHYSPPLFIEVGPGRTLATLVKQLGQQSKSMITIRHKKDKESDHETFLKMLGHLWQAGYEIDWEKFHEGENLRTISLPTYCFDHKTFFIKTNPLSNSMKLNTLLSSQGENVFIGEVDINREAHSKNKKTEEIKESQLPIDGNNEIIDGMSTIWKAILGFDTIHSVDDFFELGGHSLLVLQLIAYIKELFNVEVNIRDIFEYSKMSALCDYVKRLKEIKTLINRNDIENGGNVEMLI